MIQTEWDQQQTSVSVSNIHSKKICCAVVDDGAHAWEGACHTRL